MKTRITCLCLTTLLFAGLASLADTPASKGQKLELAEPKAVDLSGLYEVRGTDLKSKYVGHCLLMRRGQGYIVNWLVGGLSTVGAGIHDLEKKTLSVSWSQMKGEQTVIGLTHYHVNGQSMKGWWVTIPGDWSAKHHESLTWVKELPKADELE